MEDNTSNNVIKSDGTLVSGPMSVSFDIKPVPVRMATNLANILKAKQHSLPTEYTPLSSPIPVLELLDDEVRGEGDRTMGDLYKELLINEDMILIIDREEEEQMKQGLIAVKYKYNKAAKTADRPTDNRALTFVTLPFTEEEEMTMEDLSAKTKIQVYLKARATIRVHKLIITDKEF